MAQLDLLSHRDDPDTSRRAAKRAEPRAQSHMGKVLADVREFPGLTATRLAELMAVDEAFSRDPHARLYQVRRRLSDLRRNGWVRRVDQGDDEVRWFPE